MTISWILVFKQLPAIGEVCQPFYYWLVSNPCAGGMRAWDFTDDTKLRVQPLRGRDEGVATPILHPHPRPTPAREG